MTNPLLRLNGLSFGYPDQPSLFQDIAFELHEGERVGLIGATGTGKTSLLHLLVGLLKVSSGFIEILGKERREEQDFVDIRGPVGLLFQDSEDQLFCPTVAEDVAFGPLNLGKGHHAAAAAVDSTLARLGLSAYRDRVTYKLSGGEQRLVALATVLAMEPRILLLDEPTAGLDEGAAQRVKDALLESHEAMIVISHDHDFIQRIATRVVRLRDKRLEPVDLASMGHLPVAGTAGLP